MPQAWGGTHATKGPDLGLWYRGKSIFKTLFYFTFIINTLSHVLYINIYKPHYAIIVTL